MEKLNLRQKNLVMLLIQQENYRPVSYYAEKLIKTNRTIYSDIDRVNTEINDSQLKIKIDKKPGVGIKLIGTIKEKMAFISIIEHDKRCGQLEESPVDRQFKMAKDLLLMGETITHQKLAKEFHVSTSSISKDLEKISEAYSLNFETCHKGTYVKGDEKTIQRSIFKYIDAYLFYKGMDNEFAFEQQGKLVLTELFGDQIVEAVFAEIEEVDSSIEFLIPEHYRKSILMNVLIFIFRLSKERHVKEDKEFLFDQIRALDTYYLAHKLLAEASKKIKLNYDEQDISFLNRQIIGYGVKIKDSPHSSSENFAKEINQVIKNMSEIMHTDFSQDIDLFHRFSQHFIPMIYRLKMGIGTINPLLSEIKNQYSIIFSSTWYALANVENTLQVKFNDDEVAYLAMYFQVSLEKMLHGRKILILCPTGLGTSELIYNRVKRVLPAQDTIEITTIQNLLQSNLEHVDLIISSIHLENISKPIIKVSPLLTEKDVKNISTYYFEYFFDDHTFKKEVGAGRRSCLRKIIDPDFIVTNQVFSSKDECLNYIITKLENENIVTKNFRVEVFEREKLGETALDTGVAVPHAAPQSVLKTKVFILTLNKGLFWDNKRVNCVLLICIAKKEKHLVRELMTDVHTLISSEENIKRFLLNKDALSVYQEIMEG